MTNLQFRLHLISGDQLGWRGPTIAIIATTAIPPPSSPSPPPSPPPTPNGNQKAVRGHDPYDVDPSLRLRLRLQRSTTDHARAGPAPLAVVRLQGGRQCVAESYHFFCGTAGGLGTDQFGYQVQVRAYGLPK